MVVGAILAIPRGVARHRKQVQRTQKQELKHQVPLTMPPVMSGSKQASTKRIYVHARTDPVLPFFLSPSAHTTRLPAVACVTCVAYGGWPPRLVAGDHAGNVYLYDMTEMRLAKHAGAAAAAAAGAEGSSDCGNAPAPPPPFAPLLRRQEEHDGCVTAIAIGAASGGSPARYFFTGGEDAKA